MCILFLHFDISFFDWFGDIWFVIPIALVWIEHSKVYKSQLYHSFFNILLDCFNELGISSNTVGDGLLSSSTHVSSREASKGRLNNESLWVACQVGSCSPQEAHGANPWIQVCLSSVHKVTSVIVQGPGNFDNIAKVTEFSLSFSKSSSGVFQSYSLDGSVKVCLI